MSENNKFNLRASWCYDIVEVELSVSKRNWTKIVKGQEVTIRGKGYYYEGDYFWDYWDFSGGLDGELRVRYGSPKDGDYSGEGTITTVGDAIDAYNKYHGISD